MEKTKYEHEGVVYEIDSELRRMWLEREGILEGDLYNKKQYKDAMECVIANAKGRLGLEGRALDKEAVEQVMEEVIREELMLTGGEG